ncbi:glycosyltransferase [Bacillus sp. J33]|uniref:glycosyltransferase n=1 Tax=Bacillus sp. J33 TaxID=935836 RepID=UPI00047D54D2|nr:glycosyltransferase [Bacillus sp. J33]
MTIEKELILITNRYPFYPGEEFLTLELEYLCEKFSKVHLIPINARDFSSRRELPENTEIHIIENLDSRNKLLAKSKGLTDPQGRRWFFNELGYSAKFGYRGVLKLLSWIGIGVEVRDYILKQIMNTKGKSFICYSYWLSLALGAAFIKEENTKLTAFSRGHGGDIYEYRHRPPYLPLKQKVIEELDRIYLISKNGVDFISGQYPRLKDKLQIARLGTSTPNGESFESPDDVFRIVSCSYMVPVKRLDLLASSLKNCKNKIHWTHIGDGPDREKLENIVKVFPNNITHTFTGSLTNEDVIRYYIENPVDMFINVSSSEGIPVSIMEAFSCHIPAMATDVGGTSELVNSENGVLLSSDISSLQLASKIDEAASLPVKAKRDKREKAYSSWLQAYNAEANYTKFAEELNSYGDSL